MPVKPRHLCNFSGCGELTTNSYCEKHTKIYKEKRRLYDKNRPSYSNLYRSARWQALRKRVLFESPTCLECSKENRVSLATIVDHIVSHKGNEELFWQYSNLQPLCKQCHDRKTSREESWNSILKN